MRKLLVLLASFGVTALLLAPAGSVRAENVLSELCAQGGLTGATACEENNTQPTTGNAIYGTNGILTRVARLIALIVGMASIVMFLVGGFKYITASGDPSNVKSAQDTITYALIGIVVAATARGIVVFVLERL